MNLVEHTAEEPTWLKALVDRVVEAVEPMNAMGRMGYRWLEPSSATNYDPWWILAVYPTPNEARGGSLDGSKIYPGFRLNLTHILAGFSRLEGLAWVAPTVYNGNLDGPEVQVRGVFAGNVVQLRIFSLPPDDEEATLIVDLASGECRDK